MDPGTLLLVLGVIGLVMAVPITAILTHHQRKMAAIINAQRNRTMGSEVEGRLIQEISELRQLVAQQAIALDDLSSMHRRLLERTVDDGSIRQRLSS